MKILKNFYRVARSILFSALILLAALYLAVYVLVSMPAVENMIRERAQKELSDFIGSRVAVGSLEIYPFNEVRIENLRLYTPKGELCASVDKVGAGINLWLLITQRRIELTYGEIIGMDARLWQNAPAEPLNIDFLIKAFAPKDRNKPPAKFDLRMHNVIIRRCAFSYDKRWIPRNPDTSRIDFNHIKVNDIRADIYLPRIKNDDFKIDLRRLSLKSKSLLLEQLSMRVHLTPQSLSVEDLIVKFPGTEIRPSDIVLNYDGYADILPSLKHGNHELILIDNVATPSDFKSLLPALANVDGKFQLSLEASGNADAVVLDRLEISKLGGDVNLGVAGKFDRLLSGSGVRADIDRFRLSYDGGYMAEILGRYANLNEKAAGMIKALGDVSLNLKGKCDLAAESKVVKSVVADCELDVTTAIGNLAGSAEGNWSAGNRYSGILNISSEGIDVASVLPESGLGNVALEAAAELAGAGKDLSGNVDISVPSLEFRNQLLTDIHLFAEKHNDDISLEASVDSESLAFDLTGHALLSAEASAADVNLSLHNFNPLALGVAPRMGMDNIEGNLVVSLTGNNPDNLMGSLALSDVRVSRIKGGDVAIDHLDAGIGENNGIRSITLSSDFLDASLEGHFQLSALPGEIVSSLHKCFPDFIPSKKDWAPSDTYANLRLKLSKDNSLSDWFKLPVRTLTDVPVSVDFDGREGKISISAEAMYLQQGAKKLIQDTRLSASTTAADASCALFATSVVPAKKGDLRLSVDAKGLCDDIIADIRMKSLAGGTGPVIDGGLSLALSLRKEIGFKQPDVSVKIASSGLDIANAHWNIDPGRIDYSQGRININSIRAWHDDQLVEISGTASSSAEDAVDVRLHDFDLDYLFDTLNINYVTFGGKATGEIRGTSLLSGAPVASTKYLYVENLSYNGATLGNAEITSAWDNDRKMVGINAEISDSVPRASVKGGVWVTRDSLSFDIKANKVDISFLKPFMVAFTSDVQGRASGKAKLFGTFSDIDLTGRLFADTIRMKVDYTNVYYSGSDSVIINPGRILIPDFRLYDKYGHSAKLRGEVKHKYFHDPSFDFRLSEVDRLLCYDTNASMNPDWYGTIFGSGYGSIRGWPGIVNITVDMTTVAPSHFTFVLNDTQAAEDYKFLSFTDREKERRLAQVKDSVPDFVTMFRSKVLKQEEGHPSVFSMGIRATVTPGTLMTLVMDPVGGDKINARGNGALQIDYDSESDNMLMYGKYTLEEGNYNFTLQDLILKDFNIRQGSSISFNGDPLRANLDITAAYRVNTNLSDLDKSFSTDKDLNRTNVPVDAMLKVSGDMTSPDISFDIELPTLTQDVARKVKSIVSTEDMMNQQIIYLLALNRFYTPEYMGGSNGGELASVASSTLSSQLVNMMGQLTDKFTVAPSIRSDKGDFSDVEVDLALSSRLLNNRLLLNGNFGYRDRSTSSTTFIGDFDLEYMLSKNGNLRLKAYNHFNDQNYYLRSALTTQGIGIIYRRDFDNPFTFLRRRKKRTSEPEKHPSKPERADSVAQ